MDSARLADALAKAVGPARDAVNVTDPLDVLIQVSLDDDPRTRRLPARAS